MVGCWALWEHRNKVIFGDNCVNPESVIRRTCDVMDEIEGGGFLKAKMGADGGRLTRTRDKGWIPPPREYVKVNVDAGVKEGEGVGMGVVCRDERGGVLWCASIVQEQSWDPRVAEAAAVLEGVKEAVRFGHTKIILESDCLPVIEALKRKAGGRSIFSLVIADILAICSSFSSIIWSFVSRANNCVAHELAHPFPRITSSFVGSESLPPSVNNAVLFDLSFMAGCMIWLKVPQLYNQIVGLHVSRLGQLAI
ncbi:uncharacterized protein LOC141590636 [Silene latifolia]|uniref:uncharacterized protein LOC141590636 n=1 Tax=Silene latifolia TaxID=37657 RepID=UPI003D76BF38